MKACIGEIYLCDGYCETLRNKENRHGLSASNGGGGWQFFQKF